MNFLEGLLLLDSIAILIYSPQQSEFELLSELSSSWVSKVWKPKTQHPQKLHSDLHALQTKTLQSCAIALTPLVIAVTGLISATLLRLPIVYFRLQIFYLLAKLIHNRDQ